MLDKILEKRAEEILLELKMYKNKYKYKKVKGVLNKIKYFINNDLIVISFFIMWVLVFVYLPEGIIAGLKNEKYLSITALMLSLVFFFIFGL